MCWSARRSVVAAVLLALPFGCGDDADRAGVGAGSRSDGGDAANVGGDAGAADAGPCGEDDCGAPTGIDAAVPDDASTTWAADASPRPTPPPTFDGDAGYDGVCDVVVAAEDGRGPLFGGTACQTDADCQGELNPWVALCIEGFCDECATDADCRANPSAGGPRCFIGFCQCDGDFDCAGNPWGPRCDRTLAICTCADDGECDGDSECCTHAHPYLTLGGVPAPMQCL